MPVRETSALDTAIKQANIDELVGILDRLDAESKKIVTAAISGVLSDQKKAASVAQVRKLVKLADDDVRGWIVSSLPQAYVEGIVLADDELATKLDIATGTVTVEQIRTNRDLLIHKDAINALIAEAYLDFGNGMNGLVKGAERQLSDAVKRQTRAKFIAGTLTGQSIDEIRREVVDILGGQGFSVLTDRAGRAWSLPRYGEMLARTHVIRSGNEGTINRAAEFNTDIVVVSRHAGSCKICQPYEGRAYSISGKSKKYPKLDVYPPYHPNCRHSLELRPDLNDRD